jgi:murein DD-endopeptidase MepM/ murein hydrolase activator NlpD
VTVPRRLLAAGVAVLLAACTSTASTAAPVSVTTGVSLPPIAITTPTTNPTAPDVPVTGARGTGTPGTGATAADGNPGTTSGSPARPTNTPYGLPVQTTGRVSWARVHHDYPASDIFAGPCGTPVVSPVNGVVSEVRRLDSWVAAVDDPATRGGRSITILGDDGVRYYLAHLQLIDDTIQPKVTVATGERLGELGRTGKASACHLHFGISPPCPGKEFAVRRGVVWPWPYLDSWRTGGQLSPALENYSWIVAHPQACAAAMKEPNAAGG